jgi:hypothetical protein
LGAPETLCPPEQTGVKRAFTRLTTHFFINVLHKFFFRATPGSIHSRDKRFASTASSIALFCFLKENPRQSLFPSSDCDSHVLAARSLVRKPSLGAILLALIPFVAICFSVPLWDRIYPMILGLPFNFFWLIAWLLLTPLCMWGAYRQEARREMQVRREDGGTP